MCIRKNSRQPQPRWLCYKISVTQKNKWLRLVEILFVLLSSRAPVLHIEVYREQTFIITEISYFVGLILSKKMIFTLHGGMLPEFSKPIRLSVVLL